MTSMSNHKPELLPPEHPDAPKYWMHETSGALEPVVRDYLNGNRLSPEQVKLMRAYLYQWVNSPVWAPSGTLEVLRLAVAGIENQWGIAKCIEGMELLGMDPL
jgi:hypothetical protein